MNTVGTLASEIVTYSYPDDTGRFSVTYVSGWIATSLGEFNGLTHEFFEIDGSGNFSPELCPIESGIFTKLYEIQYAKKAYREALRGIVWGGSTDFKDTLTMVKEGDSVIQKVSKHQVAISFRDFAAMEEDNLRDLLYQYNNQKASPLQVAGEDGYTPIKEVIN